ncbi:MAG TPA: hypothetical protein VEX40_11955, partial [Mycobacterium sp.]|nr:hypothetical protein [Mycobacterium sp.]
HVIVHLPSAACGETPQNAPGDTLISHADDRELRRVHGQAGSGGSAQATENPSRSTCGSRLTRPPI